ncbi:MAG: hydroxyacid dehydrogenase [Gammaproteobacteria bacterium]|nr:hydroxyacid dehydrogenase [Gammaproteobacteria bacterium]
MRILIVSSIDPETIDKLSVQHTVTCAFNISEPELLEQIRDNEVLIFRSGVTISRRVLEVAPKLRLIIRAGSGFENIDLEEMNRRNIPLLRFPKPSAQAVAELTFAHMLGLARNVRLADSLLRKGHWAKHDLENFLIAGKTIGIVGVGNIGARVGELGVAWGMQAIGCVEHESLASRAQELKNRGIELMPFDKIVPQADFLTIHVPLSDSTRGLINGKVLANMKVGSYLINMARGGVVDEAALYEALTTGGRLRGAGLDVHENEGPGKLSPLRELPNVILTPHIGATTKDTQREIGRQILEALERYQSEGKIDDVAADARPVNMAIA